MFTEVTFHHSARESECYAEVVSIPLDSAVSTSYLPKYSNRHKLAGRGGGACGEQIRRQVDKRSSLPQDLDYTSRRLSHGWAMTNGRWLSRLYVHVTFTVRRDNTQTRIKSPSWG